MDNTITIRQAHSSDFEPVVTLLQSEKLPVEDIDRNLPHFFVAEVNRTIAAAAGLEWYGPYALLRSVVTATSWRNAALATRLVQTIMDYASEKRVKQLYLITTTAEKYFEKKGFVKTDRMGVPAALLQSKEFSGICPVSATVMRLTLQD